MKKFRIEVVLQLDIMIHLDQGYLKEIMYRDRKPKKLFREICQVKLLLQGPSCNVIILKEVQIELISV